LVIANGAEWHVREIQIIPQRSWFLKVFTAIKPSKEITPLKFGRTIWLHAKLTASHPQSRQGI
jgi:hypothetical protein